MMKTKGCITRQGYLEKKNLLSSQVLLRVLKYSQGLVRTRIFTFPKAVVG